ncbi:MAG: hypothetical protein KKH98_03635, partial [Spirochaetes bacterium]|nr:hypothetical protein [Spirochaetota bacterium]
MKKYLNKENFILFYTLVITGLYPVFLQPARLSSFCSPLCAVLLHYFLIFVFFGMIPMSILKLVFKEDLKEYGLNFNNRAAGWKFILVVLPVLALLIWLSAGSSEMAEEYPLFKGMARNYKLFFLVEFFYLLYYIGWEFLFRGFIIRGLMKLK